MSSNPASSANNHEQLKIFFFTFQGEKNTDEFPTPIQKLTHGNFFGIIFQMNSGCPRKITNCHSPPKPPLGANQPNRPVCPPKKISKQQKLCKQEEEGLMTKKKL
jgi:hypothetical protein